MKLRNKRGQLLVQNVVFLILNLIFLTILFTFVFSQSRSVSSLEETYSKKIALAIDSARPVMIIELDLTKIKDKLEESERSFEDAVIIKDNLVRVQLEDKTGYSYSFFNDVEVNAYPDRNSENDFTGLYVLTINKNEE